MKIKKGKTLYIGGKKYRGEIPDDQVPAGLRAQELPAPVAREKREK
jgi:hypothetical protein